MSRSYLSPLIFEPVLSPETLWYTMNQNTMEKLGSNPKLIITGEKPVYAFVKKSVDIP